MKKLLFICMMFIGIIACAQNYYDYPIVYTPADVPSTPEIGMTYFNAADSSLKIYNGLDWEPITSEFPGKTIFSNDYFDVYVDKTNGDDNENDGTELSPYKTLERAIAASPSNGHIIIIHVAAGTYNWSEVSSLFINPSGAYMLVGTPIYSGQVLTTTKAGENYWTFTETLSVGELQGEWIERIVSPLFGNSATYPIWNNTANAFWTISAANPSMITAKIVTGFSTVMNVDQQYVSGLCNVEFRNFQFESDIPLELYNASDVNFTMCEFNLNTAGYETLAFNDSRQCDVGQVIINHLPSSTSGDALESSRCWGNNYTGNLVTNQDTDTRCQGIEFKQSVGVCSDNIIDGFSYGVKIEASEVALGGHIINNMSGGAFRMEDEGYCAFTQYLYAASDSIILYADVDYMLVEATILNSGRYVSYPGALLDGTYTFSSQYTNLQYDARIESYIRIGAGTVTVLDGN